MAKKNGYYALVVKLTETQVLAAAGGWWRCYHALDKARRELGYERAVQLDPKGRAIHEKARRVMEKGR